MGMRAHRCLKGLRSRGESDRVRRQMEKQNVASTHHGYYHASDRKDIPTHATV